MGFHVVCSTLKSDMQLGIHKLFAMASQLLSFTRNLTLITSISVKTLGPLNELHIKAGENEQLSSEIAGC